MDASEVGGGVGGGCVTCVATDMNALATISKAKTMLAKATKLEEVLQLGDEAEMVRHCLKASGANLEARNFFAEHKLRCDRKAGGILAKMEKDKGGRPTKTGNTVLPVLSTLGISKIESHRHQKSSRVPDPTFEAFIVETNEADGPQLGYVYGVRLLANNQEWC